MTLWGLVLAVHILAMAVWTGGTAYTLLVLRPSMVSTPPGDEMGLHGQILRRFFLLVWHAMPLVLITGWAMVFGVYGGFANLNWAVNGMQALGIVMAAVFLALFFGPWRQFRRRPSVASAASIWRLLWLSLALAVVVTVLASLAQWGS